MQLEFIETLENISEGYTFPYRVFATREKESLAEMYDLGFHQTRIEKEYFELTRSLRVNLKSFEKSSENRRILRKLPSVKVEKLQLTDFEYDFEIGKFAIDFYQTRFGEKIISAGEWKWLFTNGAFHSVIKFTDTESDEIIGYCICADDHESMLHYAYPFYSLEDKYKNLGIYMMTKTIIELQKEGYQYIYLGSVVHPSSRYKLQFEGLEWYDGQNWNTDIDKLKELLSE